MAINPLIRTLGEGPNSEAVMPVLFVGHGSPMNAIEDNPFSRAWGELATSLPQPTAVLCISAHWESNGTRVTTAEHPRTIHDFHGFPQPLFEKQYPAPGSPDLARLTQAAIGQGRVELDTAWGLDHGAWSVLCRMFPRADVPVVQLSLDRTAEPARHYELARQLRALRRKGVLIVGSGNLVHSLREVVWQEAAHDWALEFDAQARQLILAGDHASLIDYQRLGRSAELSIPTNEHYLPLLYALALQEKTDGLRFFAERVTLGSISMRSLRIG
jgi:4,5-DOPA dioxygenase extradiol